MGWDVVGRDGVGWDEVRWDGAHRNPNQPHSNPTQSNQPSQPIASCFIPPHPLQPSSAHSVLAWTLPSHPIPSHHIPPHPIRVDRHGTSGPGWVERDRGAGFRSLVLTRKLKISLTPNPQWIESVASTSGCGTCRTGWSTPGRSRTRSGPRVLDPDRCCQSSAPRH